MIPLDTLQIKYLLAVLERQPDYWVKDKLIENLLSAKERKEKVRKCSHSYGEYSGIDYCCKKCGAHGVGMSKTWSLVGDIDPKDFKDKYVVKTPLEEALEI